MQTSGSWFRASAVATGAVLDLVLSRLVIAGVFLHLRRGLPTDQAVVDYLTSDAARPLLLALGLGCSVIGGVVCGLLARRHELHHGLVQAVVIQAWQLFESVSAESGTGLAADEVGLFAAGVAGQATAIVLGAGLVQLARRYAARRSGSLA